MIDDELLKELVNLQGDIYAFIKSNDKSKIKVEEILRNIEKHRASILDNIKIYNERVDNKQNKITTIDNRYEARYQNGVLKIYIPELMPKYKQINNFTYKRILLNIAEITKPYRHKFKKDIFLYIKIYDNQTKWDIDNKYIKPISDGLILSETIVDDNIDSMYYCVRGFESTLPHTEVYVVDGDKSLEILSKNT